MEIKKNIRGYVIDLDFDEYDLIKSALRDAQEYWNNHFGMVPAGTERYGHLLDDMEQATQRYLRAKEVMDLISCFCCKNCLPPAYREGGKMCKLEKCHPDPA